jgi:poly-beta-1,6-N-acetyl-D-glucosamine N-deacetylase
MVRALVKTVMLVSLLWQPASAAVILMYHHVDDSTPAATSVTPAQFEDNLNRLATEGFEVVRLDELVARVRAGIGPRERLAAITFDDAYRSIYETGLPLLEARGWQAAVFINTDGLDRGGRAMTSAMVTDMHRRGHLVLNHTRSHPHMVRQQPDESEAAWLQRMREEVLGAAARIETLTGEPPLPWLAWPYGEQNVALRTLLRDMGYIAFGQQSGAVDSKVDWQNVPRIPVNRHQAEWRSLRDKVLALPFPVRATLPADGVTVVARPELTLVMDGDWRQRGVQCFIGRQVVRPVIRFADGVSQVMVRSSEDLPVGRSRYNCTAAAGDGRFHWYSWVWMRRDGDGWYPE